MLLVSDYIVLLYHRVDIIVNTKIPIDNHKVIKGNLDYSFLSYSFL